MKKNNHYKAMAIAALLGTVPLQLMAQKLQVIKGEVDCGRTGYEMPVTATFELKNKGGRKMRINKVKMSCGCTQAHYPKGEIGSGDKFSVTLTYDARMLGHFEKYVALYTNATDKPVYLTMKGVVEADYVDYSKSYPYQIGDLRVDKRDLEFDDVNKGDSLSQELLIVNVGSRMLTPNLMHLPPYLSAQVMPEKLGGGKQGKILLTLHSSKLRDFGLTQTSIYLGNELGEKVSQDNEMVVSTVLLPQFKDSESEGGVTMTNHPQMELSAETLQLPLEGKKKRTGEFVIANRGNAPLKVRSLQLFTDGIKVMLNKREIAPGEEAKLKVTIYRDELKKLRREPRVLMITNDPKKPKVTLHIQYR